MFQDKANNLLFFVQFWDKNTTIGLKCPISYLWDKKTHYETFMASHQHFILLSVSAFDKVGEMLDDK